MLTVLSSVDSADHRGWGSTRGQLSMLLIFFSLSLMKRPNKLRLEFVPCRQGDQKIFLNRPIFQEAAKTVSKPKMPKYLRQRSIWKSKASTSKHFYNKPCFEIAYLRENMINLIKPKVVQNVAISLGYFIFSKNHNVLPKAAKLAKNHPIWSPFFPTCPIWHGAILEQRRGLQGTNALAYLASESVMKYKVKNIDEIVINLFSSSLTNWPNKLKCLSLTR